VSAFDVALWDLMAKQAGLPLYSCSARPAARCRPTQRGWLVPLDELVQEALEYKAQGFRHYKMKVGCADVGRTSGGRRPGPRSATGSR
jgi:L-alanine-DL-glutamate epimerase-like enolase superfamily enzyme